MVLEHRGHDHLATVQMTGRVCGDVLDARSGRTIPGPGKDR